MNLEEENARHIEIINEEMGELRDCVTTVKVDMATVKTDVAWLKRSYWVIVTASTGALVTGIVSILIMVASK